MSYIREKLRENWILKITAILLAWILWLFIQGETGTVTTVTVPVKSELPTGMVVSSGLPSSVQVVVRGSSQDLECWIDLKGREEGETTIALGEENIRFPKGLGTEVIQVNPSQVVLMLEKKVQKIVPITVPIQGPVAKGMEIYETIPDPDRVTIEGPRSQIEPLEEIPTEVITLDGQRQSTNFRVRLNIKDGAIRSSITDSIWVVIDIGPRRTLYVVKGVPVFAESSAYVSSPRKVDIQVLAPESMREALVPDNFEMIVDEKSLDGAAFPAKVKPVAVPTESWTDKVKIAGIKPPEVSVSPKEAGASKR
jgi:hypothetical protein